MDKAVVTQPKADERRPQINGAKSCCQRCARAISSHSRFVGICGSCAIAAAAQDLKMSKMKKDLPLAVRRGAKRTHFEWGKYIAGLADKAAIAPVTCFRHCVFADIWETVAVNTRVELPNRELLATSAGGEPHAFWVATILSIAGYHALVRDVGYGTNALRDYWINLCSPHVHPVGWCAANKKLLVPPPSIECWQAKWSSYLEQRLTSARTLPCTFHDLMLLREVESHRFRKGMILEVIDKECISKMKVAKIVDIVGGRLHLTYEPGGGGASRRRMGSRHRRKRALHVEDFWCHHLSLLIHPIGWAADVGHATHGLAATEAYMQSSLAKIRGQQPYDAIDCTPPIFQEEARSYQGLSMVQEGMKLEAVDPLNLSAICVATVMRVLNRGYLMIAVDGIVDEDGSQWFCYHASSPMLFPMGFCQMWMLELTPPAGYEGTFHWADYMIEQKARPVPPEALTGHSRAVVNPFKTGMKLEAVDLIDPKHVCVATVQRVVGRLVRISFDGWDNTYDQWIDCESPDIYPAGWCEVYGLTVNYPKWCLAAPLEAEQSAAANESSDLVFKTRKGKLLGD